VIILVASVRPCIYSPNRSQVPSCISNPVACAFDYQDRILCSSVYWLKLLSCKKLCSNDQLYTCQSYLSRITRCVSREQTKRCCGESRNCGLTWRGWDGQLPNGLRMVAFVSYYRGHTWPEYLDVMHHPERPIIYWESKILELPDGRLLAAAWAYDEAAAIDDPNQYTLSADGGQTWLPTRSTGLLGQTLTPFLLPDGRILCVSRRMDEPGLWANVSRLEGDEWINESCKPLWGASTADLTETSGNMVHNFHVLRFGAPCITGLADGTILVSFWCYEECVGLVRWFKLNIE